MKIIIENLIACLEAVPVDVPGWGVRVQRIHEAREYLARQPDRVVIEPRPGPRDFPTVDEIKTALKKKGQRDAGPTFGPVGGSLRITESEGAVYQLELLPACLTQTRNGS